MAKGDQPISSEQLEKTADPKRILLAINPNAAFAKKDKATRGSRAAETLRSIGHEVEELVEASYIRLEEAITRKLPDAEVLVVAGGDGMMHLGVNRAIAAGKPLGLIPAGTGNDASRILEISQDPVAASLQIDNALRNGSRMVDTLRITGEGFERYAFGMLSAGFDALVNERANIMHRPKGPSRYTLAMLAEMAKLRPRKYRYILDGVAHETDAILIAVSNNQYVGGGMRFVPHAEVDDGQLEVFVLKPLSRTRLLSVFPSVFSGKHVKYTELVEFHSGTEVTVEAEDIVGYADGERLDSLPLTVKVMPSSLEMLA
ncbi:MAG: diacylglycerol kinase [Microbacteriaceae bacterium]|nr:diacylglycerol kinase [Microbacteriaceae bacterium]